MKIDSLNKVFTMKGERRIDGRIQVHTRSPSSAGRFEGVDEPEARRDVPDIAKTEERVSSSSCIKPIPEETEKGKEKPIGNKKRKVRHEESEKLNYERADRTGRLANYTKNKEGRVAQIKRSRIDKGKQKYDGRSIV